VGGAAPQYGLIKARMMKTMILFPVPLTDSNHNNDRLRLRMLLLATNTPTFG
jgi:hypothetical protein